MTVLALLGGLAAGTLPAQAIATYNEACPGYAHSDSEPIREWEPNGPVIGQVHAGVRRDVGRVCVATIKHRWSNGSESNRSRTIARIDVHEGYDDHNAIRSAWDDGYYLYYAGDQCTSGPPDGPRLQCSTRHARDLWVRIEGDMAPPGEPGNRYQKVFWATWDYLVDQAGG